MKPLHYALRLVCLAAFVSSLATSTYAQNIVQDGGFEQAPPPVSPPGMPVSGPFSAFWTVVDSGPPATSPTGSNTNVGHDQPFAFEGTNHANLGAFGAQSPVASLSQSLITFAGQRYTLSFALANDSSVGGPNFFRVFFGTNNVLSLTNVGQFGYTVFTFSNLLAPTASTNLRFEFRNDDDFFRLDRISVVPELTSTGWLALPTFAGLLLLHSRVRRNRKSSVS